jgi:hypothetical protein
MSSILVDGASFEVTNLSCELTPPRGPAKLRFACARKSGLELQEQVCIDFQIGAGSYRGTFRITHCTLGPDRCDFEYSSVGAVVQTSVVQ